MRCHAGPHGVIVDISPVDNTQTKYSWKNAWEKARKYIPLAIFIGAAFVLTRYITLASLRGFLEKNEELGFIVCLFAYVALGTSILPSEPVTLMVLAWKGPVAAVILSTFGNTLSAVVDFYVGKSIGNFADFEKMKAKLPFHLGQLPMNSPITLIVVRFLPGYGSKFISIAGGVYRVPMFTYIWTALVANLIGAIVIVTGGYGLIKVFK
jgi:uncharacterized membrane protein YdjX (TVP38/TMEM64 family)